MTTTVVYLITDKVVKCQPYIFWNAPVANISKAYAFAVGNPQAAD